MHVRYPKSTFIQDLPVFNAVDDDDLRIMIQSTEEFFSEENMGGIDQSLEKMCTRPDYIRQLPELLGDSTAGPTVASICLSILRLIEFPHSLISIDCASSILFNLCFAVNVNFIRFLQQHDLFRMFLIVCDPLAVFEPDVRDAFPIDVAILSNRIQERILLSVFFVMQIHEIQELRFPICELASCLSRMYWSSSDDSNLSLIFLDISFLVDMYYSLLSSPPSKLCQSHSIVQIREFRILPFLLPDRHLPLSIPLLQVIWFHDPFLLKALVSSVDVRDIVLMNDIEWDSTTLVLDLDRAHRERLLLQSLLTSVLEAGRDDWMNECLELLIECTKPRNQCGSRLPDLIYQCVPFDQLVQLKNPESLTLCVILCRKLMSTDLLGCDFVSFFHHTGVIAWLNSLASDASFGIADKAMHALVSNMSRFGPDIIEILMANGFLDNLARHYQAKSHPTKYLEAMIDIAEFVTKCTIDRKRVFIQEFDRLQLAEEIWDQDSTSSDSDQLLYSLLEETLNRIREQAMDSLHTSGSFNPEK
jgi:hypothetical protein